MRFIRTPLPKFYPQYSIILIYYWDIAYASKFGNLFASKSGVLVLHCISNHNYAGNNYISIQSHHRKSPRPEKGRTFVDTRVRKLAALIVSGRFWKFMIRAAPVPLIIGVFGVRALISPQPRLFTPAYY